ncbi:MAG: hypothetical protein M3042_00255 [Actinomycetota bacterium]|nr:hypothetical protein [Actinomycetota bacterium]
MTVDAARAVADAVLYEGYLLYPYRSNSAKNQVRWQYGIVGPLGAAGAGVGEESTLHTECLLDIGETGRTELDVHLRFLQVQARTVQRLVDGSDDFAPVDELTVDGQSYLSWQEAVEQEVPVTGLTAAGLLAGRIVDVAVAGGEDVEFLRAAGGQVVGRLARTRRALIAELRLDAEWAAGSDRLLRLRVTLDNRTLWADHAPAPAGPAGRDLAAQYSFVGTHLLLAVRDGAFVSLIDPPGWAAAAAAGCTNRRCWPVLVGDAGSADVVLASPIILYDHPELAPESPGPLYDSTEIDEILTLRIMTLTEEEKAAARATDSRAAAIIDRSDAMPPEMFEKLHGALRSFGGRADPVPAEPPDPVFPTISTPGLAGRASNRSAAEGAPWWDPGVDASVAPESDTVRVGEVDVAKGTRVRLRPSRRADAQDLFLADRTAVVTAVYSDVDGNTHVAVVLEDDPASDLHEWYGRYYYFGPEEIEPLRPRRVERREGAAP